MKRWFFEKILRRKKPTIDEMGVAPAPAEPVLAEPVLAEPAPAEPSNSEPTPQDTGHDWTEFDPGEAEPARAGPDPSEEDSSTKIPEGERVAGYVERVLDAMRKKDRARRWLLVKFIIAWLVAYALVTGEVPWFIVKIWDWVNVTFVQGGWTTSAPLNQ